MKIANSEQPLMYEDIKIIFDEQCISITMIFEEEVPYTLSMCLDTAKRNGYKEGAVLVIAESYLSGKIFRYGNYDNDEKWYQVGTMIGFA